MSPSASLHRPPHKLGDVVEVRCEDDGMWYEAVVEHETADGSFMVRHSIVDLKEGEVLKGRVTDVTSMGCYVDIGADEEGFVHISQIRDGVDRASDEVRSGQDVTVQVLSSSSGSLKLSMKPARGENLVAFQDLQDVTLLHATITQILPSGALATVQLPQGGTPCPGYIAKANMGRFVVRVEDVLSLGQEVCVKVVSTKNDRLSLALNDSLDLSYFAGLGNETWIDAKVEHVAPFGVFLEVPCPSKAEAVTGLLPVSEMADFFVADPNDLVSVGDELLVRVIGTEEGKLVVSAKPIEIEADLTPFRAVAGRDQFLSGSVQAVSSYGAYVMVQPPSGGIACRGFVMTSDMELTGRAPEEVLEAGQHVNVRVLSANRGRMMLSMLPAASGALANISSDVWLKGVVKELVPFGAFVELQVMKQAVRGLVHISEISDEFVEDVSAFLQVGQEVDVRVKAVREDGKTELTMRMLEAKPEKPEKPEAEAEGVGPTHDLIEPPCETEKAKPAPSPNKTSLAALARDEWYSAVVQEVRPFGAKLEVRHPETGEAVLGWVPISEVSDRLVEKVSDVIQTKEVVMARVVQDLGNVSFSLRKMPRALAINATGRLCGIVENLSTSGALLRISQQGGDVMGFLPSGEVALSLGEEVAGLRVLSTGAGRLAVTTRPPYTTSTLAAFANVSSQLWLRGAVQQTTAIAIFVVLQPPGGGTAVKGFVHVAELDERAVDEVFVGDSIRVRILDTSRGYLELSLKPLDAAA